MKKSLKIGFILCFFMLLLIAGSVFYFNAYKKTPLNLTSSPQVFNLAAGTSMNQLIAQLDQQKIITQPWLLKIWIKLNPELAQIKSGLYDLNDSMTIADLLTLFNSAQGKQMQYSMQFIEGKKANDYLAQLAQISTENKVLAQMDATEIAEKLGLTTSLEGWIAPETYFYTEKMSDFDVLKKAYLTRKQQLEEVWQNRAADLPYQSPYEMLIMASIIEKETGVSHERDHVASVFVNRLNKGMKLQTDPTIIYGLGDRYDGKIYKSQLNDAKNPYNTYIINGLPPTPISMPSLASLIAAAHPKVTSDLYFVADGKGGHSFTSTYKAHLKAVEAYRKFEKNKDK